MKKYLEIILFVIITLLIIWLLFFGFMMGVNKIMKIGCEKTAKALGLKCKYSFWTDCLVKVEGRWIDIDNYNEVGVK